MTAGDALLQNLGIVERRPDRLLRGRDTLAVVHLHGQSLFPVGLVARWPRRRSTVISARIDIAISSGVIAPRSSPAGALTRSIAAASDPPATSFSRSAAILRRLPTKAGLSALVASAPRQAASCL